MNNIYILNKIRLNDIKKAKNIYYNGAKNQEDHFFVLEFFDKLIEEYETNCIFLDEILKEKE